MPNEGKPENAPVQPTATPGSEAQPTEQKPANPTVEMSDSVKSYLKGLGLEGVQATPELVKVAEAGMNNFDALTFVGTCWGVGCVFAPCLILICAQGYFPSSPFLCK